MKKFLLSMLGVLIALPGIARDFSYTYEGQTLTYTVLDEDAKTCKTMDGDDYGAGNDVSGVLVIPSVAKDGDIEYTVTSIGDIAFNECSGLTSVIIPNSVITIGEKAFYDCSGLTSVTIGNSVNTIGERAFYNCSGLTSVTIPNSVTTIGESAFYKCTGLTSVTIGNSVTTIGYGSFLWCDRLKKSAYPSGLKNPFPAGESIQYPREGAIIEDGFVFGPEKNAIYFAPLSLEGEYVIPNSVTTIGSATFSGCTGMNTFTLEDGQSLINIDSDALSGVPLQHLYIGRDCSGVLFPYTITSVEISNSVTEIPNFAFGGCKKLTSVIIPNSVTTIADYAFSGCTGLKKSAYPSGLKNPFSTSQSIQYPREGAIIEDGFVFGPEKNAIYFAPLSLKGEYIIPESVTEIGYNAFSYCYDLTSVIIPNSVTTIGDYAFSPSGLTAVIIPGNVTAIGNYAFYYVYTSHTVKNLTLAYGAEQIEIGNNAFGDLTSLSCDRSLENVTLTVNKLQNLTIGNSVTEIPTAMFKEASSLTSVTLGNSISTIGEGAFNKCTALTEIVLPPSVETIGASAFAGCNNLSTIVMGHNVQSIGAKAFNLCPAQNVSITAQTPPTASDNTFSVYTGKLYVQGQEAADAYLNANSCWNKFETHVMIEPTEMTAEGNKTLTGKPGDTFQLKATLYPEDVTLPHIFWRSTNPDIATVDANGLVTLHADMSEVMAMAADDDASANSCKIIAESLYANGPAAEFTVNNITTGIEDVIYDGGTESGDIDFSAPVEVFNLQGMRVAHSVENLANGIYIVRQGKNVRKIAVK